VAHRRDEIAAALWKGTGSDYVVVGRVTPVENGQLGDRLLTW